MMRPHFALLAILAVLYTASAQAEQKLVLVASAQSPIQTLKLADVRKLYLGVPLVLNDTEITPLRNMADTDMQEVFMQKVMYMSSRAYERQILNRVFRSGGHRPEVYTKDADLAEALSTNLFSISYMWEDSVLVSSRLKIVGRE